MTYVERGEPGAQDGFEDRDYARVGIDAQTARSWRRWAVEPLDAIRWLQAGVDDPVAASQWASAGVQPGEVAELASEGISSSMAAQWREFGADAATALSEHRAGRTPTEYRKELPSVRGVYRRLLGDRGLRAAEAIKAAPALEDEDAAERGLKSLGTVQAGYLALAWVDAAAKAWAYAGIDAFDARDWIALGVLPSEAARCEREGLSATQTALWWWRAGIPADEMAVWLGAGLTPEEAVTQRASGVTVEQAAVLRSLRQAQDRRPDTP